MSKGDSLGWRGRILDPFPAAAYPLTLVDDPDGVLLEEGVSAELDDRGYTLLNLADADPIGFRLAYEARHRPWDAESAVQPLVVRTPPGRPDAVPYDLVTRGRTLRLGLDEVFPSLHYGTLKALPLSVLDALAHAAPDARHTQFGERETATLVLRHVYDADPASVRQPEELLRVLLRLHYRGLQLPAPLADRFVEAVRQNGPFDAWPLEQIVSSRASFLAFLQERWPLFVAAKLGGAQATGEIAEHRDEDFELPGPAFLPLDHEDVRVYVDNFFLEGFLEPIDPPGPVDNAGWMVAGLHVDPYRDRARRLAHLLGALSEQLPDADAPHTAWVEYAPRWGELAALLTEEADRPESREDASALASRVDERFTEWTLARYNALRTQPPLPPAMLHHVPPALAHRRETAGADGRVALVLLDGLAFAQWAVIAPVLSCQLGDAHRLDTSAVFAWLPTLTPVSRQAVFSGQAPYAFAKTIRRTDRDAAGWESFWSGRGLPAHATDYLNVEGDPADLAAIRTATEDHRVRALGLVVRKVDKIVHGATLGARTTTSEARQWAETGWLADALQVLLGAGFEVVLTSDHGNVESVGVGRPSSGVVATDRGERVRIYDSPEAREPDAKAFPDAVAWTPAGLPQDVVPLFAPPRSAFVTEGDHLVSHGGISLEEVIVPLITIRTAPS